MSSQGIYLGPADPLEWLRGFVDGATFATDVRELRDLADRIGDLEPSAIELLRPDGADPDCPAGFRSLGGGVVLHELGRHPAAARWAIREAVVRGWWRYRDPVPRRAAHRAWAEDVRRSARRLLDLLRTASPRDRMAIQQGGLLGGSRMLPARPDLDGPGWLATALESLERAAAAELRRLGEPSGADRQPDRRAGASPGPLPTAAHDAVPIWLHFRPDQRPASTEDGPFDQLVRLLEEMATGRRERYVRRDVRDALRDYATAIARTYG
jgi:hypothetical protein